MANSSIDPGRRKGGHDDDGRDDDHRDGDARNDDHRDDATESPSPDAPDGTTEDATTEDAGAPEALPPSLRPDESTDEPGTGAGTGHAATDDAESDPDAFEPGAESDGTDAAAREEAADPGSALTADPAGDTSDARDETTGERTDQTTDRAAASTTPDQPWRRKDTAAGMTAGAATGAALRGRDPHHDDGEGDGDGRSFAARALMLLIFALVIFGLSLWLVPNIAPHLPANIARHLMPGQAEIDNRLAAMDDRLDGATAGVEGDLAALKEQVAALTDRVGTTEETGLQAQASAAEAAAAAERDAAAGDAVERAEAAAAEASRQADAAAKAASEAGAAIATASGDTADLATRVAGVEDQLASLSEQMQAINESLAGGGADGEAATPELAAAVAALRAQVESLGDRSGVLTASDAERFVTQDDLRAARLATQTEIRDAVGALPPAQTIVVKKEFEAQQKTAADAVDRLTAQIAEVGTTAEEAAATAAKAEQAATSAAEKVDGAIRTARLSAASAALTSRLQNGLPFAGALDEAAALAGTPAPEALTSVADRGVATTAELLDDFDLAARRAVEADIEAETGGGIVGQTRARIGSMFAGRPANEQEGDTVGAILSRVGARLEDGDAAAALAEAETLPEGAQAALGDWLGRLKSRVAAVDAAKQWLSPDDGAAQG